jgi:hypothetical protein
MVELKNGDFASFLQQNQGKSVQLKQEFNDSGVVLNSTDHAQSVPNMPAEILMDDEAVEHLAAQISDIEQVLSAMPPITDEELDRQALEAGGADGNPETPE